MRHWPGQPKPTYCAKCGFGKDCTCPVYFFSTSGGTVSNYIPDHLKYQRIKDLEAEIAALKEKLAAAEKCIEQCRSYASVVRSGWVRHGELKDAIAEYDREKEGGEMKHSAIHLVEVDQTVTLCGRLTEDVAALVSDEERFRQLNPGDRCRSCWNCLVEEP